jgi:hypothetical protein
LKIGLKVISTPDFSTPSIYPQSQKELYNPRLFINELFNPTLESGIDVGQEMNVGPEKLGKNNKRRALNKRRASEF